MDIQDLDDFNVLNNQIKSIKADLDDDLIKSVINLDSYNRSITILAYEMAIGGYPDDCLLMLMNIKDDYFNKAAIQHFKDDEFFRKAVLIFEVLSFMGKVEYQVLATQKQGEA